jgi:hypothetical protein
LTKVSPVFGAGFQSAAGCTGGFRHKLVLDTGRAYASEPEWMKGFGKLKRLHKETVRVQSVVDQEFEVIEPQHGSTGKGLGIAQASDA